MASYINFDSLLNATSKSLDVFGNKEAIVKIKKLTLNEAKNQFSTEQKNLFKFKNNYKVKRYSIKLFKDIERSLFRDMEKKFIACAALWKYKANRGVPIFFIHIPRYDDAI